MTALLDRLYLREEFERKQKILETEGIEEQLSIYQVTFAYTLVMFN